MFIHLRACSSYSFLRGLAAPLALAETAAGYGMPALALTDHHSLSGAVEFYAACLQTGVKPLLGLTALIQPPPELATDPPGLLTLLAMDLTGWGSLCHISSALVGAEEPLPFEQLASHTAGLICLTGGRCGSLYSFMAGAQRRRAEAQLANLAAIFSGRLYVELQNHAPGDEEICSRLAALAHSRQLPTLATHDIHYIAPQQAHLQQVAAAIRMIRPLNSLEPAHIAPPEAYFVPPEDMARRFERFPAALERTFEVTERCQCKLPLGVPHFPEVSLPPGQTALSELRRRAEAGARQRYQPFTSEVQARIDHELSIIEQCGYATLFLIVADILDHARRQGVPISSRGSAASSLVAHCLGITAPDPLRLNLYFERFLNPARATPPDIDTDLCSRRRDSVIQYVYDHFGAERVAMVCTVNRFRSRSALREVAKAHGLPPETVSLLAESLPHHWYGPPDRQKTNEDPYAELAKTYPDPIHQAVFHDAAALIGLPHHLSVHPGGMVISPGPMHNLVPTIMAAKGVLTTQFDLESVEQMGLVKIDLLGIRGLTVLGDVAESIVAAQSSSPPAPTARLAILEAIPQDDPTVSALLQRGGTIGCFQIESPGMRATLREIHAANIDDLMVALALYRPGPLTGGLKDAFVRRHLGRETPAYQHPALQPLLADTYGVILYQEQVLRIAHELAGLSLADADLLRRAMSHFDPGKQMQTLKEKFILGAAQRHQVPPAASEHIWEQMAAFAGYGFPKAHAASYALLGWRAAWCKLYHPAVFMAAVLANWGGYYSQRVYLNEARRMGLTIRPPHINHAAREFSVQYLDGSPVLFMGLEQVKDLTRRTQAAILSRRPFHSCADFLARVDPRPLEAENLVKVGALAGLGTIPALLHQVQAGWLSGQLPLFATIDDSAEWDLPQQVTAQEELLGASVVAHPLELAASAIASASALSTLEAAARPGQRVRLAGMRQTWRRSRTTSGDPVYFMALEDLEGMLDVVITSTVYRQSRSALSTPGPYIIEGLVEQGRDQGEPFLRAERIWSAS